MYNIDCREANQYVRGLALYLETRRSCSARCDIRMMFVGAGPEEACEASCFLSKLCRIVEQASCHDIIDIHERSPKCLSVENALLLGQEDRRKTYCPVRCSHRG
jgi:hypothetical protein